MNGIRYEFVFQDLRCKRPLSVHVEFCPEATALLNNFGEVTDEQLRLHIAGLLRELNEAVMSQLPLVSPLFTRVVEVPNG